MLNIHATAIIAEGAVIGEGTSVGPYSVIGSRVVLGENNRIGPHVVIEGNTKIGKDNQIFQFASVGAVPQDLKFHGEDSRLEIGDGNIVREFVTLQPGTQGGGMITKICDGNLFMANSHVGHDSLIGSHNIIANSAAVAGHVIIEDYVGVGGLVGIHQFVRLGSHSYLGGGAMVTKDVPPYCIAQGDRAGLAGLNEIGLERKGFSSEEISNLRRVYRELFMGEGVFAKRIDRLLNENASNQKISYFLKFIADSKRGVTMPRKNQGADE